MQILSRGLVLLLLLLLVSSCATAVMQGGATGDAPRGASATSASDARITREVRTRIYRDDLLVGDNIQVATRAGVVTLSGSVADRLHVNRAMELARSVEGVRGINLELKLKD